VLYYVIIIFLIVHFVCAAHFEKFIILSSEKTGNRNCFGMVFSASYQFHPAKIHWCMCDRASYMKMTRGTNLMQQLWFIIINNSTCFGHLYVHLQECRSDTNSHTVHKTTHRLLRTTATTPSAEHHIQQYTTCTPEDGHIDVRNI